MVILTLITDIFTVAEEINTIAQDTVGKILHFFYIEFSGVLLWRPQLPYNASPTVITTRVSFQLKVSFEVWGWKSGDTRTIEFFLPLLCGSMKLKWGETNIQANITLNHWVNVLV